MLPCRPGSPRRAAAVTVASGVACFALVMALVPAVAHRNLSYLSSYLRVDAVSAIFLLATGFLYAAVAVYSVGYTRRHEDLYRRRFYAGLKLFAWSMLAAPLMSSLALLWIAVEVATIISALLVAIEDTDGAAEATWKYVLIASVGLGLALLGTVFAYFAGSQVLGEHYNLDFQPLILAGPHLPATPVRLAFLLALLGYGTKVGLFPVHTWLPDAHSEAPTPVSALLSGSLLAVSFYAILRFYQMAAASLGSAFPLGMRCWRSAWPRSAWRRCTCSASGTSSGCWPTRPWSTWASWPSTSLRASAALTGSCCTCWRTPRPRARRSWARARGS